MATERSKATIIGAFLNEDDGIYPITTSSTASEPGKGVSVLATSTTALAANADRKFATFVNDSDETIYLRLGVTAVASEGIRLNANGGSYEINLTNLYVGIVTAICASGSKTLCVTEG